MCVYCCPMCGNGLCNGISLAAFTPAPLFMDAALRDLVMSMDRSSASIPPIIFLQVLHLAFPRFAEKGEGGVWMQQVGGFFTYDRTINFLDVFG